MTTKVAYGRSVFTILCVLLAGGLNARAELRVSEADAKRAAIERPAPVYPIAARQLKVVGHVEVEASIGADGNVQDVRIVSGNPMLTRPCVDAVKKWKFKPFEADGKPSAALASLNFDFGRAN